MTAASSMGRWNNFPISSIIKGAAAIFLIDLGN